MEAVALERWIRGCWIGMIGTTVEHAEEIAEATINWPIRRRRAEMPLARERSFITGVLEQLAKASASRVSIYLFTGTDVTRIKPGHQRGSRRPANGVVIKLREPKPSRANRSMFGVSISPPKTAVVAVTHVVEQNQHDVGPIGGGQLGRNYHDQRSQSNGE